MPEIAPAKVQQPAGDPYKFFEATRHDLIVQDASFQLLKPGETFDEILAKTAIPDQDFLMRICQAKMKLERYGCGEKAADPKLRSGVNFLKGILIGLNSVNARSRGEFIQGLSRVFAPTYFELMKTGKITSEGKAKKHLGILKSREDKQQESDQP